MLSTQWFKVLKHVTYNECEWNQPTFPLRESCLECGWVHIYAFVVNTIKSTFLIISINWLLPFFYLSDQAMLSIKTFLKTKLKIWKKLIKVQIHFIIYYTSFIYLTQRRENTYRSMVFLICFVIFFETDLALAYFYAVGKLVLDNELLKLWCMKKATM